MDNADINKYLPYFRSQIEAAPGLSATQTLARIDDIMAAVRGHLTGGGYDADTLRRELRLATSAADELKASQTPPQAATSSKAKSALALPQQWRKWILPALGVVALLVYLLPIVLFLRESVERRANHTAKSDELILDISVASLDLPKDTVVLHLRPESGVGIDEKGQLTTDLSLDVESGNGVQNFVFKAGLPLLPWAVAVPIDHGDILDFPFDRYRFEMELSGKENGRPIKFSTVARLAPHGFNFTQDEGEMADHYNANFLLQRSGTIIFIVLLATASLALVTFASTVVAWEVVSGRRKAEFSMMTWSAALLFVVPTVRNSLPGAIPQGALIDFVVFFWLQVLAALAAAALVYAWWRQKPE